jgi:hypothetical protein
VFPNPQNNDGSKIVLILPRDHHPTTIRFIPGGTVQWALPKKTFAYKFYSYLVGKEPETKDLHSKLSLEISSRARHTVKSLKIEEEDGLQAD